MKLSIIIPCYNEKETIEELIQKVLNSQIDSKEIIIVDDFSLDGTRDILREINIPEIKIFYNEISVKVQL